jgi:hypothetical protein
MTKLFLFMALLVLLSGILARLRTREAVRKEDLPLLDDEALRAILEEGVLRIEEDEDEPLDPEEIEREEERFWDQHWD